MGHAHWKIGKEKQYRNENKLRVGKELRTRNYREKAKKACMKVKKQYEISFS